MNINSKPQTQHGAFLLRILSLMKMLEYELEWEMTNEKLSPERIKKLKKYKDNFIGWVQRDIMTSTPNSEAYRQVFAEMNSDRCKDLSLWLDAGLNCDNIEEVLEAINKCAA